jgi:shikimate dehydrogenase
LKPLRLGLLGHPLGHSLSPIMHEHLLKELNRPGNYELLETPRYQLEDRVARLRTDGLHGFNVTIPFKQRIVPLLDEIDEDAKLAGAVNTVLIRRKKLHGFNTDKPGFERTLKFHNIAVAKSQAVVLGAGGAARAIVLSLVHLGVRKIYLANRTISHATALVEDIGVATGVFNFITIPLNADAISGLLESVDIVINTTSVGMWPNVSDAIFEFPELHKELTAIDLVYNPLQTRFLGSAKSSGARVVDGLDLFVFQGIEAMQLWSRRKIDLNLAYPKLRALLTERLNREREI